MVVVAGDARWLSSSLEKHYGSLLGGPEVVGLPTPSRAATSADHQATPDDYLEKILQIPFWVRPLDHDSRSRIVLGLISPSLTADRSATTTGSVIGDAVPSDPEDPAIATPVRLMAQGDEPKLHPQSLEVTDDELEIMQVLSPLLGDSPRSVKRFVNVYRLMKSLAESADAAFMTGTPHAAFKLVLFLGAVVTGMPGISAELFRSIREPHPGRTTLAEFAAEITGTNQVEATTLQMWLQDTDGGTWGAVKLPDLVLLSAQLARFSFRSEVI